MGLYFIWLNKRQETFLDLYLTVRPLRSGHKRRHYPGLVANNFINSLMKYENVYREQYKQMTERDWIRKAEGAGHEKCSSKS